MMELNTKYPAALIVDWFNLGLVLWDSASVFEFFVGVGDLDSAISITASPITSPVIFLQQIVRRMQLAILEIVSHLANFCLG